MSINMIYISIFGLCLVYINYTKLYYHYCHYAVNTNDWLVPKEREKFYKDMCYDVYRDYSKYTLLKYTIHNIYALSMPRDNVNINKAVLKREITRVNIYSIKFELTFLKISHLILHIMFLYFAIMYLPYIMLSIISFVLEKLLYIFFFYLVFEGFLKVMFDMNINFMNSESQFYFFHVLYEFSKKITELIS